MPTTMICSGCHSKKTVYYHPETDKAYCDTCFRDGTVCQKEETEAERVEAFIAEETKEKYDYYKKGFTPYEIIRAYPHITDPAHQHALKKLLRLGQGHKDLKQDLDEVIDSLVNYREFLNE